MLLFMDGQAHYDTAGIPLKYTSLTSTACTWEVTSEGRFGNCIKRVCLNAGSIGYLAIAPLMTRQGVWTPTNGGVLGFAIKVDGLGKMDNSTFVFTNNLLEIIEGPDYHLRVHVNVDGTLMLIRNNGGAEDAGTSLILAQSVEALTEGAWHYIEFKWVIHLTAGSFECRVNHVTVLSYTGPTTELEGGFPSTGVWNVVRLLALNSNNFAGTPRTTVRLCDLYLADLVAVDGDDVDDFLGDGIIETIMPDGAGASTGWTPSSGPNWAATNDLPAHDGDSTYVAAATVDAQDTYTFEDVPVGAVVKGVHVNILARKEEEGSSVLAPVTRQGGVDYVGPSQGVASVTYDRYLTQAYDINPATGAPWTAAEVNAGQWGVKKVI